MRAALAALAVLVLVTLAGWQGSSLMAKTLEPYNWRIDLPQTGDGVAPGGSVSVFSPNEYAAIQTVSLFETADAQTREVPLAHIAQQGGALMRTDGSPLLQPDRSYRLVVRGKAFDVGQPWPAPAHVEREMTFSTQHSPVALHPSRPMALRYGQDVVVDWTQPLKQVEYQVTPPAKTRLVVDPTQPARTRIVLDEYRDGTEYLVTITRALAVNGVALQQRQQLAVDTPTFPRVLPPEAEPTLRPGQPLELRWNTPIHTFQVQAPSGVRATTEVDPSQPTLGRVRFEGLAQGREYTLAVTAASGLDGAPLAERRELRFRTPQPLAVAEFGPEHGATGVAPTTRPYITFTAPVADRAAAERAFQVDPRVAGSFEWNADTTLVFLPDQPFDYQTKVSVHLGGGPQGARSAEGGYVDGNTAFSFVTQKKKIIDVNLSTQTLALYEGDQAVFTSPTATGVPGAETPVGDFTVQYKMSKARFRGVNVDGSKYDIPDVPWVLAIFGDYTIHAAPWRSVFGRVGSNGCVSLPTPAAKFVYDWAAPSTPINVHY